MATFTQRLNNIRQKPDHIKRHIAFWTSLCVTMVIVLFWIASASLTKDSSTVTAASSVGSPWSAMAASVSDAWTSLRSSVGASTATYQAPPLEVAPGK